jgi:hypothetical protein
MIGLTRQVTECKGVNEISKSSKNQFIIHTLKLVAMLGMSSSVVTKGELTLAEKINSINEAINLMGERGNTVRFDNYSPRQLFDLQQSFPCLEIRACPLGSSKKYYLILEIEHVTLFSKTITDEE